MSVDSTSGIFAKAGRAAEFYGHTRTKKAESSDLAALLGAGNNDQVRQNLPGTSTSLASLFKTLDADGDGSVSQNEFDALPSQFSSSTMGSLLSAQEDSLSSRISKLMTSADADKSGGLSVDELSAAATKAGITTSSTTSLTDLVKSLDTDNDGTLSASEIKASIKPPHHHRGFNWQALAGQTEDTSSTASTTAATDTASSLSQAVASAYSVGKTALGVAAMMALV